MAMMGFKAMRAALGLLGVALAVSGCAGAVVGGAATAGVAAYQERGIAGFTSDTSIEASIVNEWFQFDHGLAAKVSVEVYESRALLTGAVTDPQMAADAVRLAWKVADVKDVLNEIQVVDDTSLLDAARDTWISTRLRTELTFDADVYAINYAVETVNGVVYLLGIAQSQAELDRVVQHANAIDFVRKVVSHARVLPAKGTEAAR